MANVAIEKVTEAITVAVEQCNIEAIQKLPVMQQTIVLANGMRELRNAMSKEVVDQVFMPLQGSKLGFRTDRDDKDPAGYPWQVVRDCVIDAMIRGFRPIGNELNIIAGNPYYTKEAYERKVSEFPGLTDFRPEPGIPHMAQGGALVPYHASWKLNGVVDSMICDVVKIDGEDKDRRIAVKVNNGAGVDNILGKAKRKFYARVYERLSGVKTVDDDVMDVEGEAVTDERKQLAAKKTEDLVEKHRAAKNGKAPQSEERQPGEDG